MRLKGLGQLKNPITLSGIEPATFRLVALLLNQLRYRVPRTAIVLQIRPRSLTSTAFLIHHSPVFLSIDTM
jgi:hypothetical protein